MFNDLKVSSSISGQLSSHINEEYPNFVNFLRDYYKFLETNGNSLDLLNNVQSLIDVDTYTEIDLSASLYQNVTEDSNTILVSGNVNFPQNNGLLKINDEVIFYKSKKYISSEGYTEFRDCLRGYTFNTLDINDGFIPNIKTVASNHDVSHVVYNQSYVYFLYFLEKLRSNYLIDFPANILEDNIDTLSINIVLKKIKDFYLSKGTPKGIEFYFKFLFNVTPELRNYKENLIAPSEAIYQSKQIIRAESLDSFNSSNLVGDYFVQNEFEYPIQTVENVFSFSSQVYEFEVSNGITLEPTKFTKITTRIATIAGRIHVYVDSTRGFPKEGFIRIRNRFYKYDIKEENYFVLNEEEVDILYDIDEYVYDLQTLASIKSNPASYFVIYAGVSGFDIETNYTYYQKGDIGFVSNFVSENNLLISNWSYNDIIPVNTNNGFVSGVTNVYTDTESVYVYTSSIPYYNLIFDSNEIILDNPGFIKRIPKTFTKSVESSLEETTPASPVGFLRDGTVIYNWKSRNVITRGSLQSIQVENGGRLFNVHNPPELIIDPPTKLEGQTVNGVQATAELIINGEVQEVYVINPGSGYIGTPSITVTKAPGDNVYTGDNFREAVLEPIVVNGKITKVRILDSGIGYTKQPSYTIITNGQITNAVLELFVAGPIGQVQINNFGSLYNQPPSYSFKKGVGASGVVSVSNGKIADIQVVNGGQEYNSRPQVTVIDSSGNGQGAVVIANYNEQSRQVEGFTVINSGINYSEIGTYIVIRESGFDELLNISVSSWNLINNYDTSNVDPYYDVTSGGYYAGERIVQDSGLTKKLKHFSILGAPKKLKLQNERVEVSTNFNNPTIHSPIIGWALDGAPIYGPYGYSNPVDASDGISKMRTGWKKYTVSQFNTFGKSFRVQSPGANAGLNNYPIGTFFEDYYWSEFNADLDEHNGRYCVTPEYPEGVYAYFMTVELTDKRLGFPYYIGPTYAGKVYSEFNNQQNVTVENISGIKRYLNSDNTSTPKPIDPGRFIVDSVPTSIEATLDVVSVISPGTNYKIGDSLIFDNEGTEGFGAAGFVSVLKGQPVTTVSYAQYGYLEYFDENIPFSLGSTIKTADGFSATIHAIDQINKWMYLRDISGVLPSKTTQIYDTSLTLEEDYRTETIGVQISQILLPGVPTTASLVTDIDSVSSYFQIDTFVNCNITDFVPTNSIPTYIKIDQEYMKVVSAVGNYLLVERGYNSAQNPHSENSTVTLLSTIEVFDSSPFIQGDIIRLTTNSQTPEVEDFRIIDIVANKEYKVVATKIANGVGTITGNQYYLYFDEQLQVNSLATSPPPIAQQVVVLDNNGDIIDLVVGDYPNAISNPVAVITNQSTYDPATIIPNTEIVTTTFRHTLIVERGLFGTSLIQHLPRENVNRLRFVNGFVSKYESDRILARINSQNNLLVLNDQVSILAGTKGSNTYNISLVGTTLTGIPDSLTFYEQSSYIFEIDSNSDSISISFFTPSSSNLARQKEYFDLDINKTFNLNGSLSQFVILPKSSDLTKLTMRINSLDNNTFKDVSITIIPEPINGEFDVVNSTNSYFEFYTVRDPLTSLVQQYNQNNIKYTTNSRNAKGAIETVTLSSGGFYYQTVPRIQGLNSVEGTGAVLEAVSEAIGQIKRIRAINTGYGYNPDPTQKPSLLFPKISKIIKNFIASDVILTDSGSEYLFNPRFIVTGGGLSDNDENHAILNGSINNGRLISTNIEYSGLQYSSAPSVDVEKYYFISISVNGDISFKFNFKRFIFDNDPFKIRAYYTQNNVVKYVESSITFYALIQNTNIECLTSPGGTIPVNPLDYIQIPNNISADRYELIALARKAQATILMKKSPFIEGEKVIFNGNPKLFGFISTRKGWQENNSILRIENYNYNISPNDSILGIDSSAYGVVDETFGVSTSATLSSLVETPKQFLNYKSFLGSNSLKLQDSLRYQKFAYEIGCDVPFNQWRENYQNAAHPAGYNLFARTEIKNNILVDKSASSIVNVATDINNIVRLNQKYNYLLTKNNGLDEVLVVNRLLTDVKQVNESVVAAFQDISSQFNGIDTSFELAVIDPVVPSIDGEINYITEYQINQMVVLLDNIVQTYGTSWTVTDSDKIFQFTSTRDANELMPQGEVLTYRQLNEDTVIYGHNKITTSSSDTFSLLQKDSSPFPSSIFTSIDKNNYMVFVDGVIQLNSSFDIFGTNNGEIIFTEVIPSGSQVSVRYLNNFLKNEFTLGSYTTGSSLVLTNKPTISSKESYFVFIDGILMSTDDYELDGNNDLVFNYNFTYDTIIVIIDPLGVSLSTSTHNIISRQYNYKIEDGQTEIPAGYSIGTNDYILDISGVVQAPDISYNTITSGVRKINFTEPPQRYVSPDNTVGRQFIGLLYQRSDPTGQLGTTPNYQFDDISKNILHVKEATTGFIVGDYINTPTSSSVIVDIINEINRKVVISGFSGSVVSGATFDIEIDNLLQVFVGDRVVFNFAFGMTSPINDEFEITSINKLTNTITITNISQSNINVSINNDTAIRFVHNTLILQDIETTAIDRDDAYVNLDTIESGIVSSIRTGTITLLNEPYSVLVNDTEITVNDASIFAQGDYLLVNNTEIVKVTSIVSNTLTVDRAQLKTDAYSHADNVTVEKITPLTLTVSSFTRGFDGDKSEFILTENFSPVFIQSDKDIFVIVNGILQKRGSSYNLVEVNPDGIQQNGDEYSKIVFSEPPAEGTPFNCFYVGELIPIQDISGSFNGSSTGFELRSATGEIFSLITRVPGPNISANLILFIDGVYQIPSTTAEGRQEAYPDILSSFKLLGSLIEFSSPPKDGSTFEGYIYVGASADYESIDVDATVEAGDIIVQSNEFASRNIVNIISASVLSVDNSLGQKVTAIPSGSIAGNPSTSGWWLADIIKKEKVRESLRTRRTIISEIDTLTNTPYPLSGKTLLTTSIQSIKITNISTDFPVIPDDDTNQITFILPATSNFTERSINAKYTSFVPRDPLTLGTKDELQGILVGYDLPFDQIIKLAPSSISETFIDPSSLGIDILIPEFTYGISSETASIVNWDPDNQLLYVKLNNVSLPISTSDTVLGYAVVSDDLINEYQTLSVGNRIIYNF